MAQRFLVGASILIVYAVLCVICAGWVLSGAHGAEMAGMGILALGFPWSLIITLLAVLTHTSSAWFLATGYVLSCVANGSILRRLSRKQAGQIH